MAKVRQLHAKPKSIQRTAPKSKARTPDDGDDGATGKSMWTGTLSFGLINIPVQLTSAKEESDLSFSLLDKRDYGHIGYHQYNKATGKEISRQDIVKGYEYAKGKFVLVTDDDFKRANPRAVSTIDIEEFVNLAEMDPMLFESPYYLQPGKGGDKGYVLLRDVLESTQRVAIGRVVLFRKQRLVAVIVRGDYLVLEVLRFDREIRTADEMHGLKGRLGKVTVKPKEIEMAKTLVEGMTETWDHSKFKDTYTDQLLALIKAKAKKKGVVDALDSAAIEAPEPTQGNNLIDLMPLLRKSLEAGSKKKRA